MIGSEKYGKKCTTHENFSKLHMKTKKFEHSAFFLELKFMA